MPLAGKGTQPWRHTHPDHRRRASCLLRQRETAF